ncbi:MAG: hypothetical protein XD81_0302 [Bacteroidetes bacterium 38_7]|nr:MAG: hypothetical protein XD81_0302 [Bacteroidetes bacterium 38_7]
MKKILFFVFLISTLSIHADDAVRQALRNSGNAAKYPNANVLVVFDSTKVEVAENGLAKVNIHQLFKVLNSKGILDKRVIKVGYDPLSAYVKILSVTIYKKNGEIISIDTSWIKDYPAPARAIYWGAREKMIEIGYLEPEDAIEIKMFRKGFTYALLNDEPEDERYIPPMRGHFYDIVPFWSADPVKEKTYIVRIPIDKNLQYEFYNGEIRSSVIRDGEEMIYTFTKTDIWPMKAEPNMLAWSDVAPKLLLSTSPDWKAKSLWFYKVNEDYGSFETTPEISAKVSEILRPARNELDSISLLTHWAADEIRYSGLSMGEGEGYTLHKGAMTFADRCGVCKDKAGMLITLLRAAGFESYAAMTMAGERIERIPADQFNHSVTVVKRRNGDYMLLDPTWVPFIRELWSSLEQQQGYLMGIPEGADLQYTPISPADNHPVIIKGNSKILTDGTLEGWFEITGEGQSEAAIRSVFTGVARSEWEKSLENELLRMHPRAQIIEKYYSNPDLYLQQPITIRMVYRIPHYVLLGDSNIIFQPLLASGIFQRAQAQLGMNLDAEERAYPFRDRCSRKLQLVETIEIPTGYSAIEPTYYINIIGDAATIKASMQTQDNQITISQTASYNKRIYQADEWSNFKEVVKAQRKFKDYPLILKKL